MGEGSESLLSNSIMHKRAREVTPIQLADCRSSKRLKANASSRSDGNRSAISDDKNEEREEERDQLSAGDDFIFKVTKRVTRSANGCISRVDDDSDVKVYDPFLPQEARERWPNRYCEGKHEANSNEGEDSVQQAKTHYKRAKVDGITYCLGDDAYVKADDEQKDFIARITEIFITSEGKEFFCAQWFFRSEDTVIQSAFPMADERRIFISDVRDDNPLNCIQSKVKIRYISPNLTLEEKQKELKKCDLYYDMKYSVPFFTFATVNPENIESDSSTISSEKSFNSGTPDMLDDAFKSQNMSLLDLYCGCGAMSTGFCMGAAKAGLNLTSRWAVDLNSYACESIEKNHSETKVWNMAAEDFLSLIKEWETLCREFSLFDSKSPCEVIQKESAVNQEYDEDAEDDVDDESSDEDVYVVDQLLDVCYGNTNNTDEPGIHFKVRWKGYCSEDDTWEPLNNLRNCQEKLEEFVTNGYKSNILPLPGNVDVICGGPPCQGMSGFNRYRNTEAPLEDEKNKQLIVFMDIVEYLKPSYILMENVVDILKFCDGICGRYAIGRLVSLNYQARLGIVAAGYYGVPQFRNRVFLWGCQPLKCLPQYPLPTHDAPNRAAIPNDLKEITVAYELVDKTNLKKGLTLEDAISDLPPVRNGDLSDVKPYSGAPLTDFQKHIRLPRNSMIGSYDHDDEHKLYDHVPLPLNDDDYQRVCLIPKKKGANFRDLPGVAVDESNTAYLDTKIKRKMLPSGKPLVPDYTMTFVRGKSSKPFGRLWWDETVATVVTKAEPHSQVILHPKQNRVLTVRENARLQGIPDCYRLYGPIKKRYIQVGNAVAVPVAFAMGYCLGIAHDKSDLISPLTALPFTFPSCLAKSDDIPDAVVSD